MTDLERRYGDPMARFRMLLADKTILPSVDEVQFGLQYENLEAF